MSKTTKTGVLTTPSAKATTVLEDSTPVLPLPDMPQGVMAVGPQVTLRFIKEAYNQANSYNYYDVVKVDGTSYIALQNVPANTPITNTDYWVKWNDPNAQVELLQSTVEQFDGRITANTNSITTANGNIEQLQDYVDKANVLSGIAVSFGDSITRGFGLSNPATMNWCAVLCDKLGVTLYNFAVDGAGFHDSGITGQIATASADGRFENDEVDFVFVAAGINDHGQSGTTAAVDHTFDVVESTFPNAKVYFLPCLNAATPLDSINQGDGQYIHSTALDKILKWASSTTKPITVFSSAYRWLTGLTEYAQDSVHPNQLGAQVIANKVFSQIRGGDSDDNFDFSEVSYPDTFETSADSFCTCIINGDSWKAYGHVKYTGSTQPKTNDVIITLPSVTKGRFNQITPVSIIGIGAVKPAFLLDGEIKAYDVLSANIDYYFQVNGVVGM